MFQTIIGSFVSPGSRGTDLNAELLNLELLAYNFHESLNLKPLFIDMRRRITDGQEHVQTPQAQAEFAGYMERVEREAFFADVRRLDFSPPDQEPDLEIEIDF